ncbi:ribonuclease E/G-like protein, chloroplastic isoform X2 [Cornus florida]|uniref:ribonuclease E/G-like protein, chloroplastic isoform X2 n=1 Tax=Cornus florida TaxID=4283 RepID=UPI0028974D37|nr:ribonuclease E/G-like protein, chloroplastic isoform X2 [Cornus florida]
MLSFKEKKIICLGAFGEKTKRPRCLSSLSFFDRAKREPLDEPDPSSQTRIEFRDGQILCKNSLAFGCWVLEMDILMSPSEHANLWNAEVKAPYGRNLKCNYFKKGDMWLSCDIHWRPRTEVSHSAPLLAKQSRKIVMRDPRIRFHTKKLPAHILGSWIEATCLPLRPFILAPARATEISKDSHSDILNERDQPIEEPWLLQSSLHSFYVARSNASGGSTDEDEVLRCLSGDLKSISFDQSALKAQSFSKCEDTVSAVNMVSDPHTLSEKDQLVEEPWLLQSSLLLPESIANSDASKSEESLKDEAAHTEFHDQHHQATEILLPEEDGNRICQDNSISTVILINSSICTMQRIAVLEDGKLVELLLEPVKNNVQSDSVYLGVVTKLVPHMGGAFVNIGSPRPSLMDIKHNREPFIFPPFRRTKKEKEVNGSVFGMLREHSKAYESEHSSHDGGVTDEIREHEIEDDSYMHDDFQEDDIEDDFDVPEVLKENVNGSVIGSSMVETDFGCYFNQLDPNANAGKVIPVDMGFSHDTKPSDLQDMKYCNDKSIVENKWAQVRKGTKIVVQVVKEGLGTKGPTLTAYPKLRSRFWLLITRRNSIGISKKISGVERTRLRVIAKTLQPPGFGLTVRTVAAGHSLDELQKDLESLLSTWKDIMEHAKSAALAADESVEGAIPVMLHRAMGQTLSVVQDCFNEKVKSMVVDSPRTYYEVTNYLQEIAPDLCDRVELYSKRTPIFDEYNIEEEINNIISKRVPLANGGYLVIEQTEALVSIDVNGGQCMLGQGTSQEKAILNVNLAAAKQIARELRLRDIGGIIVVDFIDMVDESNKRLVYEEVKKAVERDRSVVKVSELSKHGLMEITRKRVRPSVTFMISEPCACCHATGRVEALETSFSKIEHEICRLVAMKDQKADPENPKSWPRFILRVDRYMCNYLTSGKRTRLAVLSSSLKVWILLKVARGFTRGAFEVKPLTDDKDYNNQHQVGISMLRPTTEVGKYPSGKLTLFPIKKWKTGGK